MKRAPKTIIVDTSVLTDGALRFGAFIPFRPSTQDSCQTTAQKALFSANSHHAECIREALGKSPTTDSHRPVASYQTSVIRTVWHHGADYMSHCIGPIMDIAKLTDLTENERESLTAQSSRLAGEGKIAYGLARGLTKAIPTKTSDYHLGPLEFIGIATFEPILHAKTVMMVEKLQDAGTRIVYLSRDPAAIVGAVARAAHISSHGTIYAVSPALHTEEMDLVATIPNRSYDAFVARYGNDARVIAHDLTELR